MSQEGNDFYITGADAVTKKLGSGSVKVVFLGQFRANGIEADSNGIFTANIDLSEYPDFELNYPEKLGLKDHPTDINQNAFVELIASGACGSNNNAAAGIYSVSQPAGKGGNLMVKTTNYGVNSILKVSIIV